MASSDVVELPVAGVTVGRRLRRGGAGDVRPLAESIRRLGLLHPIVVNSRHELVAGFRRLKAHEHLGRPTIPARVVATLDDALDALRAEAQENTHREPLSGSELVAAGKAIEKLEQAGASQRKAQAGPKTGRGAKRSGGGNLPPAVKGKTRDKVAKALGVSGKTYEKAKQVNAAAEADPAKFGDLPAVMDQQSVDAAHKELKRRRGEEAAKHACVCPLCGKSHARK